MQRKSRFNVYKLTYLAILSALVVILQLLGSFIHFGIFSISLVLIPIVLGAVIGGPLGGAWLGCVFGVTVLLSGDAAFFIGINPLGTVITVLAKGILCGLTAGILYPVFSRINRTLGVVISALVCPIVNTGVFLLGCYCFFMDTIEQLALEQGHSAFVYIILFMVGGNFLFELGFNLVLCPLIMRLIRFIPGYYGLTDKDKNK